MRRKISGAGENINRLFQQRSRGAEPGRVGVLEEPVQGFVGLEEHSAVGATGAGGYFGES